MRLALPSGAALWLGTVAVASRAFFGIAVDLPEACSSAWLVSLLGGALCLPAALLADAWSRRHPEPPLQTLSGAVGRPVVLALCAALCVLLGYDAACVGRGVAASASYAAVKNAPMFVLLVTLFLALWYVGSRGGAALGDASRLWLKLFAGLLAIVVIVECRFYRPAYLLPWLGEGAASTARCALMACGWYMLALPVWLACSPGRSGRPVSAVRLLLAACGAASALLALHGMMTPAAVGAHRTRLFQIVSVLANGRGTLSMQLPLIAMWFGSLLYLAALWIYLSAHMLQEIVPALNGKVCLAVAAAAACAAAVLGLSEQASALALAAWQPYALAGAFLAVLLAALARDGRGKNAKGEGAA